MKKRYREVNISEVYNLEREMRTKMSTAGGAATYRQRKCLVEPVFGNLKFNLALPALPCEVLRRYEASFS
jgi:hypothetical protein